MLIPLKHENMSGRRWPIITIALIILNVLAFLGTHWKIDQQTSESVPVKTHLILLSAMHPELQKSPEVQKYIGYIEEKNPNLFAKLKDFNRRPEDGWDARIRLEDDPTHLQDEMDSLSQQFMELEKSSILDHYAYVPAHPTAISYLTANFLHAGWLHIIGNMWFLWLAGFILEDTWGRPIYTVFYLLAGVFALVVHGIFNSGSLVPTLGASGAVAALMGAFLARFPKMKIEMAWIFGLVRMYRFQAAAYWLLPLWLLMEVFYGSLSGSSGGVAHWAHVGGFVFGAVVGHVIRVSGLENIAEQGIQEKISWVSHPLLAEANELMEKGQLNPAAEALNKYLKEQQESIEAYRMLQQIYWRMNNQPAYRTALVKLCTLLLKGQDKEEALRVFEEFKTSGADPLPAASWLEVCRLLEDQQQLPRAVEEYEALAAAHPAEKQSLLAQIAAGRICLKRLHEPTKALRFYEAAKASSVPHAEWESNIQAGIQDAQKALLPTAPSAV